MRILTLLLFTLVTLGAYAADDAPPPPPMPDTVEPEAAEGGEALEPEVTIRKTRRGSVQEYRQGGQLYMVKIIPTRGYPYYLIDTDGDGSLETRRSELDNPEVIQWQILRW